MTKVAIFVEGQGEMILSRNIIEQNLNLQYVSFECMALFRKQIIKKDYPYISADERVRFKIINVGNDEKVIPAIRERVKSLENEGCTEIIGLRDLYSRKYRELASGKIDNVLTQKFIDGHKKQIDNIDFKGNIHFVFAIMELEAWMLGAYQIFSNYNSKLSLENINKTLGVNLEEIDPQSFFFHPAKTVNDIFGIANKEYKKKSKQSESLSSHFNVDIVNGIIQRDICQSFIEFFNLIKNFDELH